MEFINRLASHPSPYVRVFVKPRETVQEQLRKPPQPRLELILLALGGLSSISIKLTAPADFITIALLVIGMMLVGALCGVIGGYLMGWLISWTGKKFLKGTASPDDVRRAIAWSSPVSIAKLPLVLLGFLLAPLPLLLLPISLLLIALSIWYLVVYIYALSAATGFAFWKAFLNSFVAGLIIVIPIFIVFLAFINIFPHH